MEFDNTAFVRLDASSSLGSSGAGAAFATTTGDMLEVGTFGSGVVRLRVGPNTRPDYGLVVTRAQRTEVTQPSTGVWRVTAGDTSLDLSGAPLSLKLSVDGAQVLQSITDEHFRGFTRLPAIGRTRGGMQWIAAFALGSGEPVYGLGEKFGPLNKRGQIIHSQVEDALGVNTGLSYKNVPFAWGMTARGAWGVFVNTPGHVVHGVGHPDWSHRSYGIVVDDEALDLFLIAGRDPAQVLDRYTQLTGRAPMVPLWSLGLWVSKAYYRTPEEAAAVAAKLRQRKIPCDVLTLDGRAVWDVKTRFDFQWDAQRYPNPAAALAKMKAHGLRICVWEYPYVSIHSPLFHELAARRYLLTNDAGEPYVFRWDTAPGTSPFGDVLTPLPESGIVDFTRPAAYAWWRDAHEPLFRAGVDVIKSDFGEHVPDDAVAANGDRGRRLHNVYPLLYNRCVFEATQKFAPPGDAPAMIWARAGWSGSQRYPIQWGGDPQSDWEGLAASVRGALSWGMSGAPYHATDIGGFYGSAQPTPELYLRWLQMSVFSSHMRVHGIGAREPWAFGESAEIIAREWIEFRYRMLPYLERVIGQAVATGMPVMRAMPLAFPSHALTRSYETQFMCGDALLVAPIISAGGEVDVALPPGAWYDLATRQRIAGRQVIRYRATLERFPVFGREGFALPLGPAVQSTAAIDRARPLNALWVFGKPTQPLPGYAQAGIDIAAAESTIETDAGVEVTVFGDGAGVRLRTRGS